MACACSSSAIRQAYGPVRHEIRADVTNALPVRLEPVSSRELGAPGERVVASSRVGAAKEAPLAPGAVSPLGAGKPLPQGDRAAGVR